MNLLRSLLGRRQFLIAFVSSTLSLAFGRIAKAFDLVFQTDHADASVKSGDDEKKTLKGIVVYYSGTGNTAKIAGAIYRGMKSVIDCDVAPIKKVKPEDMSKYDVMALGSPQWAFREPANVKLFTHNMPRMDGKHCILFATRGGGGTNQFWSMSKNILKKGMTIIGWNDWYGPDRTSLHHDVPHMATGHPDEIDLMEAEAFGRQMAEYSIRIYAGEKDLIPEIPDPIDGNVDMWLSRIDEKGNIRSGFGPTTENPRFDLTKCVYPRCTQCIGNCPVGAIDFSMITTSGSTDSPLVLKEACVSCGGLCERVCLYDAISYEGEQMRLEIDMTRCTYPDCTLCEDNCPMDCLDFSVNPPVHHNWCENCGICWCICPENAVNVLNMEEAQLRNAWWDRVSKKGRMGGPPGGAPMAGGAPTTGEEGKPAQMPMIMGERTQAKFRPLIPRDRVESEGLILIHPFAPRLVLNKEDWPHEMDG